MDEVERAKQHGMSLDEWRAYEDAFMPDCAAEALEMSPAMARRCAACPGVEGTDASRDPITPRVLADCKRRRFPFWCHLTREGEFCTHLCADWVASVEVERGRG